jgi:AcrR family transcriptional regulator
VRKESAGPAVAEPGESKSARTRERILNAAAHVLSRKGYAATRLSDVADQAEVQAPAIYYYFPSREALVEEVMWTGIARMREHVGQVLAALPAGTGPIERIDAAVAEHLRYELDISDYTTAAIRNAGQVPDYIRTRYSAEAARYGEIWRKLLQDAVQAGLLRSDLDPMAARMLVLGALNWAAEWWNPRRGSLSLDTIVRTAQSLVRNGLSPADGEPRTDGGPRTDGRPYVAESSGAESSGGRPSST